MSVSPLHERAVLRTLAFVTLAFAVGGLVLRGSVARSSAATAVAVVIASPLLRVAGLVVRWHQQEDRRFVVLGLALITLIILGAALAAIAS